MNFDEDYLLLILAVCICQTTLLCQLPFKKRKKCTVWVKEWLRRRNTRGAYNTIVSELQLQDRYSYRRYLRMNCETFGVRNTIKFLLLLTNRF